MAKTTKKSAKQATTKNAGKKPAGKRTAKPVSAVEPSPRPKADSALVAVAVKAGRTFGRAARGVDRVASAVKKTTSSVLGRGKSTKGKKKARNPEAEQERARTRAAWKRQAAEANATELAKQGTLVDERSRVRAVTGMSWSNRKPR